MRTTQQVAAFVLDLVARLSTWLLHGTKPPPADGGPGDGLEIYPEVVDMAAVIALLVLAAYGMEIAATLVAVGLVLRWLLRRTAPPANPAA